MRLSADQLGAGVHILVDMEWAGTVYRLADDDLDIDSDNGDIHYTGAITAVAIPQNATPMDTVGDPQAIPLEILMPVSVPDLVAQGHDLSTARCEVSRWCEGTDYEDRELLASGAVTKPEWGDEWEAVRFSVQADVWDDESLGPMDPTAIVTGENWTYITTLAGEWLGLPYPEIFGAPGKVDTSLYSTGVISGSGAVWVWSDPTVDPTGGTTNLYGMVLLLAGHHVGVTEVLMNTDAYPDGSRFKVTNGYDLSGREVAYVNWYYSAAPAPSDEFAFDVLSTYTWGAGGPVYGLGNASVDASFGPDELQGRVYVGWRDATDSTLGGRMDLRAAGDVLEYMLSKTHIPLDYGRIAAAKPALQQYKIDCVVDAFVNPWEWIRDNLLPILPLSVVRGPRGLYFVAWRWDAVAADAILRIDADEDPEVYRTTRLQSDTSKVKNQFSLEFAYSYRNGTRIGKAELGTTPYDPAYPMRLFSPLCAASQSQLRNPDRTPRIIREALVTSVVYDIPTAHAILRARADAYALPWLPARYNVPRRLGYAEAGAVVIVNDPGGGIVERVALVTGRTVSAEYVEYAVLIQPRPGRDMYAA